jgi:hypothetical protein
MMRLIPVHQVLVAAIVVAAAAWPLAQAAPAAPAQPDVPTEIRGPDGNKLFLIAHAIGEQIYSCDATASGFRWALVAPRADLYDDHGKLIATHFRGPTWQATDGSNVVGRRDTDITVDATAIPWLRLSAAARASGLDGDRLAGTTFIQRIATTGGLAPPAADCNATTAATEADVPYTADYYFWKATGS